MAERQPKRNGDGRSQIALAQRNPQEQRRRAVAITSPAQVSYCGPTDQKHTSLGQSEGRASRQVRKKIAQRAEPTEGRQPARSAARRVGEAQQRPTPFNLIEPSNLPNSINRMRRSV